MSDERKAALTPMEARARILGEDPAIPNLKGSNLSAPLIEWSNVASWAVWARPGFSLKDRALVTCIVLAVTNKLDKLVTHLIGGFRQGWLQSELAEAMVQMTVYAGVAAGTDAFAALASAVKQAGPEIARDDRPAGAEEVLTPQQVRTRVVSPNAPQPDLGPPSLYAPLSHWAGGAVWDTWARPGLALRYRSLIVCVCTATLGRMDLLAIHLLGALRLGWKAEELAEALLQMTIYTGVATGTDGFAALARAVEAYAAESTGDQDGADDGL